MLYFKVEAIAAVQEVSNLPDSYYFSCLREYFILLGQPQQAQGSL